MRCGAQVVAGGSLRGRRGLEIGGGAVVMVEEKVVGVVHYNMDVCGENVGKKV